MSESSIPPHPAGPESASAYPDQLPYPPGYAAPSQPYGAVMPVQQPVYAPVVYAMPRPNSGLAITSLVFGLIGVVLSWLVIPAIASIVAVITGHMALRQIRNNPVLGGRGMAITGLITGYIGIGIIVLEILSIVLGLLFIGAFTVPFITSQT